MSKTTGPRLKMSLIDILDSLRHEIMKNTTSTHLINECASVQPVDLATPYIGHFQVCMQQQIERECDIFAGIKDANVKVELLFAQY